MSYEKGTIVDRIGVALFEVLVYAIGFVGAVMIAACIWGFMFWHDPLAMPYLSESLRGAAALGLGWGSFRALALWLGGKI